MKELGHVFKRCGRFSLLESLLGTLDRLVYFCQSQRESSGSKGSYHQPDGLNLVTGAHKAEERTNSYKLSLVLCMYTLTNTHQNKYRRKSLIIP